MNKEQVKNFLISKPGYLKKGNNNLAKMLKTTPEIIKEAKKEVKGYLNTFEIKSKKIWQLPSGEYRESIQFINKTKEFDLNKFKEDLINSVKEYVKPEHKIIYPKQSKNAAIINLFDAHIDKLCVISETDKNSSIEENIKNFEQAFDELLSTAVNYNPELIIFPIGNDFYNTDGPSNTTKKGTPQEVLVKSEDSFIIGLKVIRRCIDKASKYAKLYCPVIKGNHDETKVFYLGQCLELLYENNPNILIDSTRHQRKYFKYGENLFGFAHGDKEIGNISHMPLIMAEERKKEWAETTYREWFMGDKHHRFEYKFMRMKDFPGVSIRYLRSVGTSDKWHYDSGYIGIPKTAELFIYDYNKGLKANFQTNI
jgi:hypothetical protein